MLDGSAGATPAAYVKIGGARIERALRRSTNAKSDKDFEFPCGTASTLMSWCSQHHFKIENQPFGTCVQKRRPFGGVQCVRIPLWLRPMAALG
jgi:hypothetical protein